MHSDYLKQVKSYLMSLQDAICEQLADPALKKMPILTLALDMGFGSIASFNRAFKQQMQTTPSNYRDQF